MSRTWTPILARGMAVAPTRPAVAARGRGGGRCADPSRPGRSWHRLTSALRVRRREDLWEDLCTTRSIYEVDDPVATITLEPPGGAERVDEHDGREIRDALVAGRRRSPRSSGIVDHGCRAGVLRRRRHEHVERPDRRVRAATSPGASDRRGPTRQGEFGGRFPYVMTLDKPVIAAVNGAVAGMAFPFVAVLRPARRDARRARSSRRSPAWPHRRVGPQLAAPTTGRPGGGARSAVLVAPGEAGRRRSSSASPTTSSTGDELLPFCRQYVESWRRRARRPRWRS